LKGGLPNVLFVRAAVEALPFELNSVASEVRINFPWGSLLRGVATGDQVVLANLRRICAVNALLKIIIGLDFDRDRSEIDRLGLSKFETGYINSVLTAAYRNAGFELVGAQNIVPSDWPEFQTSWAKRLRTSRNRSFIRIVARAVRD
jgi:16S rRNA (adenine(1408)-N(1))-methyltransferase